MIESRGEVFSGGNSLSFLGEIFRFAGGLLVGGGLEIYYMGGKSRQLPKRVKTLMSGAEFFPTVELDKVRLKENRWVPNGKDAITLGHRIHFRRTFEECNGDDLCLLTHELVHVRQYEDRHWAFFMYTYASEEIPDNTSEERSPGEMEVEDDGVNSLESEAEQFAASHEELLREWRVAECRQRGPTFPKARVAPIWVIWG